MNTAQLFTAKGMLIVAAVVLFVAAALVALNAFGGNDPALIAIGLACLAASRLPWRPPA